MLKSMIQCWAFIWYFLISLLQGFQVFVRPGRILVLSYLLKASFPFKASYVSLRLFKGNIVAISHFLLQSFLKGFLRVSAIIFLLEIRREISSTKENLSSVHPRNIQKGLGSCISNE